MSSRSAAVRAVIAALGVALAAALVSAPAGAGGRRAAASAAATTLTLVAPRSGLVGEEVPLELSLTEDGVGPVEGAAVRLLRRVDDTWRQVGALVTDPSGAVATRAAVRAERADNVFRAEWAGDAEHAPDVSDPVTVRPRRHGTSITLAVPRTVVDERSVRLRVRWFAGNGAAVSGSVVVRRWTRGVWRHFRTVRIDRDGRISIRVRPRVDTRWRVRGRAGSWHLGARSPVRRLDNLPPGKPVALPRAAPRPAVRLPRQQRAVGAGPNAVVHRIPSAMWRSMVGRSWHRGCPVGRGRLRVVRVNYWGYDGYRYRGELVVNAAITGKVVRAFTGMYDGRYPLRSMYRMDRFGWSDRLQGADDYRSMRAGNTSAFNCRDVVGRPGVRSPHATGRAIDVNTWENPFRSSRGLVPNSWWQRRSHPRVAWRSTVHPVVRIFARAGIRWTYRLADTHHFDGRRAEAWSDGAFTAAR